MFGLELSYLRVIKRVVRIATDLFTVLLRFVVLVKTLIFALLIIKLN